MCESCVARKATSDNNIRQQVHEWRVKGFRGGGAGQPDKHGELRYVIDDLRELELRSENVTATAAAAEEMQR